MRGSPSSPTWRTCKIFSYLVTSPAEDEHTIVRIIFCRQIMFKIMHRNMSLSVCKSRLNVKDLQKGYSKLFLLYCQIYLCCLSLTPPSSSGSVSHLVIINIYGRNLELACLNNDEAFVWYQREVSSQVQTQACPLFLRAWLVITLVQANTNHLRQKRLINLSSFLCFSVNYFSSKWMFRHPPIKA